MLTFWGSSQRHCDGIARRDFLKVGALGMGGLTLPDLFRLRAQAGAVRKSPKAVIMVCLQGGPSHIDMYDMKPEAPVEIRGEFQPLKGHPKVPPGLHICDLMPKQAGILDKLALVRNLRFQMNNHHLHEVFTGFPIPNTLRNWSPPVRPAFGSIVSRLRSDSRSVLPRYISLGLSDHPYPVATSEVPLYLGGAHGPFEPVGDRLQCLELKDGMTLEKLGDRRALLGTLNRLQRRLDGAEHMDAFTAQALDLITSPQVRAALDLSKEPDRLRQQYGPDVRFKHNYQYGHTWYSSKFLLARRLVEAGVPVVTLAPGAWDDHGNINEVRGSIFERLREKLPYLDNSIHALVTDLHDRGLDQDVAVVVWGEFGRSPIIDPKTTGRHHWPMASFALFAGGGLRTGQVIGATDSRGAYVQGQAYGPQNVLATLYHVLGINPALTLPDSLGRPIALLEEQEAIRELV